MRLSFHRKIQWGYFIGFLLLLVSYFLIFITVKQFSAKTKDVAHTYVVINKLKSLESSMVDAETGMRDYLLSKNVHFLKPYNSGSRSGPIFSKELSELIKDNDVQQKRLDTVNILVNRGIDIMSKGIKDFQTNGFIITDEILADRESGRSIMDSVRLYIDKMQETEEGLVLKRESIVSRFSKTTLLVTILSLIITLITIIYSFVTYIHEKKAKEKADINADQYRKELEESVNKLKKMNVELKELKSIEKFASTGRIARTIAHEVRNPLTNISLAAEQLQEMATHNTDSSILLDIVNRNANRINQLISDLLNATRFVQLEFREINIHELIEETLAMAKDRVDLKHIKIEKNYSKDLCSVLVDADKIKLAFLNIIVNAIEAMEPEKGVLWITTKKQGGQCIIEIKDNGIGMDEETMQNLFEPYFTSKTNGNGLGLTNTQNIILNHKGNIKVLSSSGQGTAFVVSLTLLDSKNEVHV